MQRVPKILALFIIILSTYLSYGASIDESFTFDEPAHLASGFAILTKGDPRIIPDHPPIPKIISALPLLFLHPSIDAFSGDAWEENDLWRIQRRFIYQNTVDPRLMMLSARGATVLYLIFGCIGLYLWGDRLLGPWGAFLATAAFALSPTVLAHGSVVKDDVAGAAMVIWVLGGLDQFLRRRTLLSLIIVSLLLGIALLTKASLILLVPIAVVSVLYEALTFYSAPVVSGVRLIWHTLLLVVVPAVFIMWPVLAFSTRGLPDQLCQAGILDSQYLNPSVSSLCFLSWLNPARAFLLYIFSLVLTYHRVDGGQLMVFLGHTYKFGTVWYFPVLYLVKESLPWLAICAVVLSVTIFTTRSWTAWKGLIISLMLPLAWTAIYLPCCLMSHLNLGIRYLLPCYPSFVLLLSGGAGYSLKVLRSSSSLRYKTVLSILSVLVALMVVESIRGYPFYLSYFNQFVGGSRGGLQVAVDSSLDWGQDLSRLNTFISSQKIENIEVAYFGTADLEYHLGGHGHLISPSEYHDEKDFLSRNRSDGWIAVSATYLAMLVQKREGLFWLMDREPRAIIGGSIYVWDVREQSRVISQQL